MVSKSGSGVDLCRWAVKDFVKRLVLVGLAVGLGVNEVAGWSVVWAAGLEIDLFEAFSVLVSC